jgi:hypothetical protein
LLAVKAKAKLPQPRNPEGVALWLPMHTLTTLWPGLTQLWLRGSLHGLVTAVCFAAALNLAVVISFVYPEIFGARIPLWVAPCAVWFLVLLLWIGGWRKSCQLLMEWFPPKQPTDAATEALLCQAQAEYLKGHWQQAEQLVDKLLARRSRDVEGRLLKVAVLQRVGQFGAARQELKDLSQLEAAGRWQFEIARELELLAVREESQEEESDVIAFPTKPVAEMKRKAA